MAVSKTFMQCNLEVNIKSFKRIVKSKINNNVQGRLGGGGVQSLVKKGLLNFFVANYFYLICDPGCRWRGK